MLFYSSIAAALHFIGIGLIAVCLFLELFLFKKDLTKAEVRTLTKIDFGYLVSAIIVLVTGLLRWIYFEKTTTYYTDNWIFILKVSIFVLIGILSIVPTVHYFALVKMQTPKQSQAKFQKVRGFIRFQIFLLLFIPFLASLVARGFGVSA